MKSKIWRLVNYTFSQRNPTGSVFTKCWYFLTLSIWKLLKHPTLCYYIVQIICMNTSYLINCPNIDNWVSDVIYSLFADTGWWCNWPLYTPNNTTNTLHQYCTCTCITMRIIEKCNQPKLFMITGRNGLYFLLRLDRLSYAIGFQSETLKSQCSKIKMHFTKTALRGM